jgi:hypothetical protein
MRPWRYLLLMPALAAPPVLGHHSLSGVYDSADQRSLHGAVVEFRFVNPHPVLVIEVEDDSGARRLWELEMDNRSELARIGVTAETFRPGDTVFVRGSIGLTRPRTLYLRRLDRPADGLWYEQRGSRPYIGTSTAG